MSFFLLLICVSSVYLEGTATEPKGIEKIFLFFLFSFLAAPRHMEFLGQGSDPSHSCDLSKLQLQQYWILNPLCCVLCPSAPGILLHSSENSSPIVLMSKIGCLVHSTYPRGYHLEQLTKVAKGKNSYQNSLPDCYL